MTTGAGNDLERSTELARKMVCEWGMSDAHGPADLRQEGRADLPRPRDRAAPGLQRRHRDPHRPGDQADRHEQLRQGARRCSSSTSRRCSSIAEELLAREVLDAEQVRRIAAGEPLEEYKPAAASPPRPTTARKRPAKERPSIVPPLPPLNKPLTAGIDVQADQALGSAASSLRAARYHASPVPFLCP